VRAELPAASPYVVIAESFSGPIAFQVAERPVGDLRAIVLIASFVSRPFGFAGMLFARLPLTLLFRMPRPGWILKWLLMDSATPSETVHNVQRAISSVSPRVLAARLRELLTGDCTKAARACAVRIVCLNAGRDRLLGRSASEALRENSQAVEILTVSAPHFPLRCAPQAAVAAIESLGLFDNNYIG
jgi:sigma-B regulation protein RsbQ